MQPDPVPRPARLSRRGFLELASAASLGLWVPRALAGGPAAARGRAASGPSRPRGEHVPVLRLPARTTNGAKVPIVVEMAHPMTSDHHVRRVEVVNAADPIPSKGTFHFTPANGRVYLSFQARMHDGLAEVTATAECSLHGPASASAIVEIPQGAGGCGASASPAVVRTGGPDVSGPAIRIPELVERRRIRPGEQIHVQVKMRHPSRTGLVFRDGGFVPVSDPLCLQELLVEYGGEQVSRFELTPALSDDPFIAFPLLAREEAPLRIVVVNSEGRRFEASHDIRFG